MRKSNQIWLTLSLCPTCKSTWWVVSASSGVQTASQHCECTTNQSCPQLCYNKKDKCTRLSISKSSLGKPKCCARDNRIPITLLSNQNLTQPDSTCTYIQTKTDVATTFSAVPSD